jgi:hypothetical protein
VRSVDTGWSLLQQSRSKLACRKPLREAFGVATRVRPRAASRKPSQDARVSGHGERDQPLRRTRHYVRLRPKQPVRRLLSRHCVQRCSLRFTDSFRRKTCAGGFVRLEWLHHALGIAGVVEPRNRCATPRKIIDQRWDDYIESVSATRSWGVIG